ncbi:hypothetical protein HAX54_050634 [Datura stramonium]|uniref:Uncharacterized protein n=1 Tax=Datura stramonium TaxID=4076 RepID=A0ABS8SYQ8_DATST|nr:hypothetical protein [Datura stramonium]
MALPFVGSSMETAPTSLSPERESDGRPSPTSSVLDNVATLIANIRNRCTSQKESIPRSSPQTSSSPTGLASISAANDPTPTFDFSSDTESSEDLVPLAKLKKGARKRILFSAKTHSLSQNFLMFLDQRLTLEPVEIIMVEIQSLLTLDRS